MGEFESIDLECSRRAWGLAYALLHNAADADDVMQQAMVVAWRRQAQIPADPWPWLAAVVANCARNFRRGEVRKRAREMQLQQNAPTDAAADSADKSVQAGELRQILLQAMAQLPAEEREALALCHVGGLTQAQASEATGVNLNTFKARISRGLERLRDKLQRRPGATASVELYLSSLVFPLPAGGLESAAARWRHGAVGGAQPASTLPSALAWAGAAALVAVLAIWLALDQGGAPVQAGPLASQPFSGASPGLPEQYPAVGQLAVAGAAAEDAPPALEPGAHVGAGSTGEEDAQEPSAGAAGAATDAKEDPVPAASAAQARVCERVSFYDSGERFKQWTESVMGEVVIREGAYAAYFRSGVLQESGQYANNEKEGTWIKYHENGAVFYRGDYRHGKPEGAWVFRTEADQPHIEGSYRNGQREGQWTTYHENGQVQRKMTFQDDLAEGQSTEYDDRGRKLRETQWHQGEVVSQREFDESGNPKE